MHIVSQDSGGLTRPLATALTANFKPGPTLSDGSRSYRHAHLRNINESVGPTMQPRDRLALAAECFVCIKLGLLAVSSRKARADGGQVVILRCQRKDSTSPDVQCRRTPPWCPDGSVGQWCQVGGRCRSQCARGGRSTRGRSWGLPGPLTRVPRGAMPLARCCRFSVAVPCRWVLSLSETPRWQAQGRLLESGPASCTARRLGRENAHATNPAAQRASNLVIGIKTLLLLCVWVRSALMPGPPSIMEQAVVDDSSHRQHRSPGGSSGKIL